MTDLVLRRLEDGVGVVSLNRPEKHNAINDEMSPAMQGQPIAGERVLGLPKDREPPTRNWAKPLAPKGA